MYSQAAIERVRSSRAEATLRVSPEQELNTKFLTCRMPWWLHPISLVALVPFTTAVLSIALPAAVYDEWNVRKYLSAEPSQLLLLGLVALLLGLVAASFAGRRDLEIRFALSCAQVLRLQRVYRLMFWLTVCGYLFWALAAVKSGVGWHQLLAVVHQDDGAISLLKSNAQPIAGVTTLTQFGVVAAFLGALLRKLQCGGRWYWTIIGLSLLRVLFYAERLAVIEVLLPLIVLSVATTAPRPTWRSRMLRTFPLYAVPSLWALFSAGEYFRSWVYFGSRTSQTFAEYMSVRLAGYYVTSYNNSAILNGVLSRIPEVTFPHLTLQFISSAPVVGQLLPKSAYSGDRDKTWVLGVLHTYGNVQFNNTGSFLITQAELGTVGMVLFWVLLGIWIGRVFSRAVDGKMASLAAYSCLIIGLLELPRILYWTMGRCTPVLLGLWLTAVALREYNGYSSRDRRAAPERRTLKA
jgi:hypothetical protein